MLNGILRTCVLLKDLSERNLPIRIAIDVSQNGSHWFPESSQGIDGTALSPKTDQGCARVFMNILVLNLLTI